MLLFALFAVGFLAGVLNVLAGGGSFLTLPMLIFLGLPATVANGTNRVGILLQGVTSVWGFDRRRLLDRGRAVSAVVPVLAGTLLGAALALVVGDEAFRRILAVLMVVVSLWSLWGHRTERPGESSLSRGATVVAFLGVGVYAGFVQAGVGFLLLAVLSRVGMDLVRANALKVLIVLISVVLSLAIFAWQGQVDWSLGLVLAAGNGLGGLVGVRLAVLAGHRGLRWIVTLTVIAFAVALVLR
ncbi:MAG: sulfite exporter TauE/SafE family protein [Acidobacteriota bacterium]